MLLIKTQAKPANRNRLNATSVQKIAAHLFTAQRNGAEIKRAIAGEWISGHYELSLIIAIS